MLLPFHIAVARSLASKRGSRRQRLLSLKSTLADCPRSAKHVRWFVRWGLHANATKIAASRPLSEITRAILKERLFCVRKLYVLPARNKQGNNKTSNDVHQVNRSIKEEEENQGSRAG